MGKAVKVLMVIGGVILGVVILLAGGIYLSILPTHGDQIEQYENPRQALFVIDIQEDFTGPAAQPPFHYDDAEQLIATVNTIIEGASEKEIIIVYIRQEFHGLWGRMLSGIFSGGTAIEGKPGTEIDERISILSDNIFPKPRGDAFSNPDLDAFLIEHQVNELYLVGLDAEYCVHHTAWGALDRGYTVNIITDAVALRAEEKWEELLQQYREEGIILVSSQQFLEQTP